MTLHTITTYLTTQSLVIVLVLGGVYAYIAAARWSWPALPQTRPTRLAARSTATQATCTL